MRRGEVVEGSQPFRGGSRRGGDDCLLRCVWAQLFVNVDDAFT